MHDDLKAYANPLPATQIKQLRVHLFECTQNQLAELIGVSVRTVSRWELDQAKCAGPPAKLLWLLANQDSFRFTLEQMLALDKAPPKRDEPKPFFNFAQYRR